MAQHLHPEDEKALDEGIIVSRFSELQLPSWNASLGVGLPNPVDSMVDPPEADIPDDDGEVSIETVEDEDDLKIIQAGAIRQFSRQQECGNFQVERLLLLPRRTRPMRL